MRGVYWGIKQGAGGFALPTILIASTVMMLVLASTLVSVSAATIVSMETRHYTTYAKNASQSGLLMAYKCLQQNSNTVTWTTANPLRPNTNCSGTIQSGVSQYIHLEDDNRSTFSVPLPATVTSGVYRIASVGRSDRITASATIWRTYQDTAYATTTASSIMFGKVDTNKHVSLSQLASTLTGRGVQ